MEKFQYSAYYAFINVYECSLCDRKIEIGKVVIESSSNFKKVIWHNLNIVFETIYMSLFSLKHGCMLNVF